MFFVSEEFLRRHTEGEMPQSTLGEVVSYDENLFPDDTAHKAEARDRARDKQQPIE